MYYSVPITSTAYTVSEHTQRQVANREGMNPVRSKDDRITHPEILGRHANDNNNKFLCRNATAHADNHSTNTLFTPSITGDMVLLELPDALRENILRFSSVHSPDHLSLACTCRQLLQEVEAFSTKELDRITREHNVDADWLYRAGMQAVARGQQQAGF
jgi:hypothetical protein